MTDVLDADVEPISDEELAALALATPVDDVVIDPTAPSLWELTEPRAGQLLPEWYAPSNPVGVRRLRGWRRNVVFGLVATFVAIDGVGLCTTFGPVIFGT